MSQTVQMKIQKWGNGLGLRVNGLVREIPKLEVGAVVNVEIFDDGFTVKKIAKPGRRFPFSEKELLSGLNALTAHADEVATISDKEFAG